MLDSRKGRILHAIISDYVETAEPIGSEWLVTRYDFGCKSATLRNEMAEMADLGYLVQPHTSAGRIPSNLGYRYYVDRLMTPPAVTREREQQAQSRVESDGAEVEEIVQLTCRLLSEMTQYPSLATSPSTHSAVLHRLYLSPASPRHVLLVVLLSSGHVEHNLVEMDHVPDEATLQRVANYLNEELAGRELDDVAALPFPEPPSELAAERAVIALLFARAAKAARDLSDDRMFLEGTSHILRQREFQDVLRLERLFSVLEQRNVLNEVFHRAPADHLAAAVIIGPESAVGAMEECSVVTSRYWIRERSSGFIGVVGPTRMHYDRAVAAVTLMARSLSAVLTRSSLG